MRYDWYVRFFCTKRRGRPPSGPDGEAVSDFPKLTIYIRPEAKARLTALSTMTNRPVWKIIDAAVGEYIKGLPVADQKMVDLLTRRMAGDAEG